ENKIDTIGAVYLAIILQQNKTLTTLDVKENPMDYTWRKQLSDVSIRNLPLTTLNLWYLKIANREAEYLANALKHNKVQSTKDSSISLASSLFNADHYHAPS
ncbi:unnamed protein product, partial [Rotaria magnacalcarata]